MCPKRNLQSQVWMLTGDKQETAINIAFSCGLFQVWRACRNDSLRFTLVSELHGNDDC
jgi:magnesium-transporting ATPase (P-type)